MKQKIIAFGKRREARDTAAAGNAARRRRRRTGRQTLNYLLIFMIAAAIMVTLSLTVFFRIEQIEVTGNTKYAPQELIETSGVKKGDNLFRISQKQANKRMTAKYPYVHSVELKRRFPARLELAVTQEIPLGAVDTAGGYVIVGTTGKVLETGAQSVPEDLMVVTGMYLYEPVPGQNLGVYPKEQKEHAERELEDFKRLSYLVEAVEETNFGKITMTDFPDQLNMMMVYDNRIIVELGSAAELTYKLHSVRKLIESELPENFEGILDAANSLTTRRFRSDPCNVQEELDKRNLTAEAKARKAQEAATNPAATQQPVSGLQPATPASSSEVAESGQGYAPGDLDVIPNSSDPAASEGASADSSAASSDGG